MGYIGGKTQTDLAAMDDLYIDGVSCLSELSVLTHLDISALGISDEVEKLGLKGSKKKKSKKLDEDYAPILKPLQDKDVPKVIQAIRQTSSRKVLMKLLTRIKVNNQCAAGYRMVVEHPPDNGGQGSPETTDEAKRIQLDDEHLARPPV